MKRATLARAHQVPSCSLAAPDQSDHTDSRHESDHETSCLHQTSQTASLVLQAPTAGLRASARTWGGPSAPSVEATARSRQPAPLHQPGSRLLRRRRHSPTAVRAQTQQRGARRRARSRLAWQPSLLGRRRPPVQARLERVSTRAAVQILEPPCVAHAYCRRAG